MVERLKGWWSALSTRQRVHAIALVWIVLGALIHQAVLWNWYIEDAAISFAYARNLAIGEGLVAESGGERIEGYSNPTWVFLLAGLRMIFGSTTFQTAKVLQLIFAAITVPLVYGIARFAVDDDDSDAPIYAAAFMAINAQFAIWGACGLENGLFNLLMGAALYRLFVEMRDGANGTERWPLSAFFWFLLAISRPEAIVYAAIGGFASMVFALMDGRGILPTLKWLGTFWTPFVAYHGVRFWYFAYEFPQTYYAKIGDHREPKPMFWNGTGWTYFRNWAFGMGHGYLLPVYIVAMSGARAGLALAGISVGFLWALAALLPGDQRLLMPTVLVFAYLCYLALIRTQEGGTKPGLVVAGLVPVAAFSGAAEYMWAQGARSDVPHPDWTIHLTPWLAVVVAVGIPALVWGTRGARAKLVCWALMVTGLAYSVAVHGDWMSGWRWMNLIAIPGAILLGAGIDSTARLAQQMLEDRLDRGPVALVAACALLLAPLPANVLYTKQFLENPVTGPYSVYNRVKYKKQVRDRLHWYGKLTDMDVDMGAHLFWGKESRWMDLAGLVDIPLAQHRFQRDFLREYVFVERKPLYAHVHAGWASNSRLPSHPEWKDDYYELPGYPAGDMLHIGNFIRRDAMMARTWPQDENRRVSFDRGIELVGWKVPSPEVAADRKMYLEVAVQLHQEQPLGFRILGFLSDPTGEHVTVFDLPPAYDWIPVKDWKRKDIFVGKFSPTLPADLPEGTYDLGFVMVQDGGRIFSPTERIAPKAVVGGVDPYPARLMKGEVRFPGVVKVVDEEVMETESRQDKQRAMKAAEAGDCLKAEDWWYQARAHRPKATQWIDAARPTVDRAIADCYVQLASTDPDLQVAMLKEARHWDHTSEALAQASKPVADRLYAEGNTARDAGDYETAYRRYSDAVAVWPPHSWARRYAEEARAIRLRIDPKHKGSPKDDGARKERLRKQRAREVE